MPSAPAIPPLPTSIRALTVAPGVPGSMRLDVRAEPAGGGALLARTLAVGICGTDVEIMEGRYGWPPPDCERIVIGHESLARVVDVAGAHDWAVGDLVVGIVRRPDPLPCACCAAGEWDMCRNGGYTERGIKALDGFAAEWIRLEPAFAVKLDPRLAEVGVLLEPASVVAKAWDHVHRISQRSRSWKPRRALVTGAGPVGLLAALLGQQRGLEMHVFDRATSGRKPELVRALGAQYHAEPLEDLRALRPDVVIECTGAASVMLEVLEYSAAGGIVCLAGMSSGGHSLELDLGLINRRMVLENDVVFGSVNANRFHYELAAQALAQADISWLAGLICRRPPLSRWTEAFERRPDDVKVVLDMEA